MMTSRDGGVAVGMDDCAPGADAVDLAAVEAAVRGVPLRLICTYGDEPASGRAQRGTTVTRLSVGGAWRRLIAAAERVSDVYPAQVVRAAAVAGNLAAALTEESERAGLVVVGHRNTAGFGGSVAAEVCLRAACPVIVVPSDGDATLRGPVVVAIRNGDRDASAISFAVREAALRGVGLRAVHVWLNIPDMDLASVDPYIYDLAEARRDADRLIHDALDGWPQKYPHVRVQRQPMYRVQAVEALDEASAGASMLVLGASGRRMRLLGSVIDRSRRPVAVVRRSGTGNVGTREAERLCRAGRYASAVVLRGG